MDGDLPQPCIWTYYRLVMVLISCQQSQIYLFGVYSDISESLRLTGWQWKVARLVVRVHALFGPVMIPPLALLLP